MPLELTITNNTSSIVDLSVGKVYPSPNNTLIVTVPGLVVPTDILAAESKGLVSYTTDTITPDLSIITIPSSSQNTAITPGYSSALETGHVLKSSAGNLYSVYILSTSVAGFLMTFNATTVPSNGDVTPVECIPIEENSFVILDFSGAPPDYYSTGIVAAFSTTGPFTMTQSATAFFKWRVQ